MRCGLTFGAVCLATICSLAGNGESSAQEAATAPAKAIAPFDTAQAKVHQKAWADYLGVPVESTNSIEMKFVLIPPGEFMMGRQEAEPGEATQHSVTLTTPFSIGVHEVTQSQYEAVMGDNPSKFKGADNPVEMVSLDDAVAFCEKLSALPVERAAGRVYRLPTESEWEYVCRAGTTAEYSFGNDESKLGEHAWFVKNSERTTHSAGTKLVNPWGLYDMLGNVSEYCSDWYVEYPREAVSDPQGPTTGSFRVSRGGDWDQDSYSCRSVIRIIGGPKNRDPSMGFRVALSSTSVESLEAKHAK